MPRYVALLRGVSPMNAKMPELKRCVEGAGFTNVKTVLSSGNVVFDARKAAEKSLERKLEAAMQASLGRSFHTIVRSAEHLRGVLEADPYRAFELAPNAKRVVTFLREPGEGQLKLPIELDDAQILCVAGQEVFSAYVAGDKGPVFMRLIEKTFGTGVTTRTWETVRKCAAA
ncbi:DUF1697 domain-containing protein [Variovorax sp. J22R133]|uniref:DUF1697 domain-containing protein n=1 Tax=Variovorax brevis TaxID=3053503 RepID=UPI00257654EF|nr:DUF1697 domain-containing protein [Variovorax sp. J22R133]MDM0113068.1 DUF1697 domain-containing protein [Variovorax sp. J22R133]